MAERLANKGEKITTAEEHAGQLIQTGLRAAKYNIWAPSNEFHPASINTHFNDIKSHHGGVYGSVFKVNSRWNIQIESITDVNITNSVSPFDFQELPESIQKRYNDVINTSNQAIQAALGDNPTLWELRKARKQVILTRKALEANSHGIGRNEIEKELLNSNSNWVTKFMLENRKELTESLNQEDNLTHHPLDNNHIALLILESAIRGQILNKEDTENTRSLNPLSIVSRSIGINGGRIAYANAIEEGRSRESAFTEAFASGLWQFISPNSYDAHKNLVSAGRRGIHQRIDFQFGQFAGTPVEAALQAGVVFGAIALGSMLSPLLLIKAGLNLASSFRGKNY